MALAIHHEKLQLIGLIDASGTLIRYLFRADVKDHAGIKSGKVEMALRKKPMNIVSSRTQYDLTTLKARQAAKLRELRDVLVAEGKRSLDEQARTLGLNRSTAWTILHGNHKTTGLSARTVNRMLAAPRLSPRVRAKILEYIEEKTAGAYGHSKSLRDRFLIQLDIE